MERQEQGQEPAGAELGLELPHSQPPRPPPVHSAVILATTAVALAALAAVVTLAILAPESASLATSIMAAAGSFITALLALQAKNEVGVVREIVYARLGLLLQKVDRLAGREAQAQDPKAAPPAEHDPG